VQVFDGVDRRMIRPRSLPVARDDHDDFLCVLAPPFLADRGFAETEATQAVRIVNALPLEDRENRLVRLIIPRVNGGAHRTDTPAFVDRDVVLHDFDGDFCDLAIQCDAAILAGRSISRTGNASLIECLACGIPVLAYEAAATQGMLLGDRYAAGVIVPTSDDSGSTIKRLADAIVRYLRDPQLYTEHRLGARAVFEKRFRLDQISANVGDAYESGLRAMGRRIA
jgi:glycosyltransferase involved in cell wall biosynthesis